MMTTAQKPGDSPDVLAPPSSLVVGDVSGGLGKPCRAEPVPEGSEEGKKVGLKKRPSVCLCCRAPVFVSFPCFARKEAGVALCLDFWD